MLKKVIIFTVLSAILFSSFSMQIFAYQLDESEANVDGYYLYNYENDLVMAQKNIDEIIMASSTVKIMTACIALESNISFDRTITITKEMLTGVSGRFMGLREGDKMSFEDLLYSMIIASFNDATHAIAFTVADSLDAFVGMMNEKAKQLGMSSTFYADVTGMSSESKTTISDTIKLVDYMLNKGDYMEITSTKTYILSDVATCDYNKITNRSGLLSSYKGFSNLNTGSASDGGNYAVSYVKNGKSSFVCIVMNATSKSDSNSVNYAEYYTKKLLNHGIYDYSVKTVIDDKKVIDSLPVKYSISDDKVSLYIANDLEVFLPDDFDIADYLTYHYYIYENELIAPLNPGDEVGKIIVSKNGKYISSSTLVVHEYVNRNFFLYAMDCIRSYLLSRGFLITIVSLILLFLSYYRYKNQLINKMFGRNHKKKNRHVK